MLRPFQPIDYARAEAASTVPDQKNINLIMILQDGYYNTVIMVTYYLTTAPGGSEYVPVA
jgi:hypothetical protein